MPTKFGLILIGLRGLLEPKSLIFFYFGTEIQDGCHVIFFNKYNLLREGSKKKLPNFRRCLNRGGGGEALAQVWNTIQIFETFKFVFNKFQMVQKGF